MPLPEGTPVWVDTPHGQVPGTASTQLRSYQVDTPSGEVRRNRVQLRLRDTNETNVAPVYQLSETLDQKLDQPQVPQTIYIVD